MRQANGEEHDMSGTGDFIVSEVRGKAVEVMCDANGCLILRHAMDGVLEELHLSADATAQVIAVVTRMSASTAKLPVRKTKYRRVRCPKCGRLCGSPQGLARHLLACKGASAS
jgi:hypothetical protein